MWSQCYWLIRPPSICYAIGCSVSWKFRRVCLCSAFTCVTQSLSYLAESFACKLNKLEHASKGCWCYLQQLLNQIHVKLTNNRNLSVRLNVDHPYAVWCKTLYTHVWLISIILWLCDCLCYSVFLISLYKNSTSTKPFLIQASEFSLAYSGMLIFLPTCYNAHSARSSECPSQFFFNFWFLVWVWKSLLHHKSCVEKDCLNVFLIMEHCWSKISSKYEAGQHQCKNNQHSGINNMCMEMFDLEIGYYTLHRVVKNGALHIPKLLTVQK